MSHLDKMMECPSFRAEVTVQGLYMDLAESIQAIRMEQGISQAELARAIGTTQSGVARFENTAQCSFTLRSLARIAEALDCKLQVTLVKKNG